MSGLVFLPEEMDELKRIGMVAFLAKPFEVQEFLDLIAKLT